MVRALLVVALCLFAGGPMQAQTPAILHIVVTVAGADGTAVPVARHALLISDNPATGVPRRVLTGDDGSIDVRLRPGNYTIESDGAQGFLGKAYEWTETLDVPAGGRTLNLNDANATTGTLETASPGAPVSTHVEAATLVRDWGGRVVAVWTPRTRASAFVVDATRGLIATSQRAIGGAGRVEVQLSPLVKVEGLIVKADQSRNVAVLRVDAAVLDQQAVGPLPCDGSSRTVAVDRDVVALGVPLRPEQDRTSYGVVRDVSAHAIVASLRLPSGTVGGPVFDEGGRLIGLSSHADDDDRGRGRDSTIVPMGDACATLDEARAAVASIRPSATRLPVEPPPLAAKAVETAAGRQGFIPLPFRLTAADFEIAFITPAMVFASQQPDRHTTSKELQASLEQSRLPPWQNFGTWTDYVSDSPPVLLVRVTPKLSESFWAKVGRGAAMSQGVSVPAVKRFGVALSRMRAFCGDTEIAPIHPLMLETDLGGPATLAEGLYVFDPTAFTSCAEAKLMLYSDKDPNKADTRRIDPAVLDQIKHDFDAYRPQ